MLSHSLVPVASTLEGAHPKLGGIGQNSSSVCVCGGGEAMSWLPQVRQDVELGGAYSCHGACLVSKRYAAVWLDNCAGVKLWLLLVSH